MFQEMLSAGDYSSAAEYDYLYAMAKDEFEEGLAMEQAMQEAMMNEQQNM